MSWLDIFKSKRKKTCLICETSLDGTEFTEVKYRFGPGEGTIGVAYICKSCSHYVDNEKGAE